MRSFTILNTMTLKQLQDAFNDTFPYLKLEFFAEGHRKGEPTAASQMIPEAWDRDIVISTIQPPNNVNPWPVEGRFRVATLERDLETVFGLHAQVFLKSGNVWLETTRSDDFTLDELNQRGAERDPAFIPHENPYETEERDDMR